MKKKGSILLLAVLALSVAACMDISFTQTTGSTQATDTTQTTKTTNIEGQLNIIAEAYEQWDNKYKEAVPSFSNANIAVTDLNHNGRLELIISDCQGSGKFSYTYIFEVSSDCKSLNLMPVKGSLEMDLDGDFLLQSKLICYKKEDTYYYLIQDYNSAGISMSGVAFLAYSFDTEVLSSPVASYLIAQDSDDPSLMHVTFNDKDDKPLAGEEAFYTEIDNYWIGYEKQATCVINWAQYPESADCIDTLKSSFNGFDSESDDQNDYYIDYRTIYGDSYEYKPATSNDDE